MEHEDASVFAVSDWIKMSLELNESPQVDDFDKERFDAVNILTIHSAKGLEFPVVFLVNLTQGRFPTYERQEKIALPDALIKEILPFGDYHLEEERRLFYVGLTRAADYVFLTASLYYGEGKKERKISQFVVESLGKEFLEKKILIKKDQKKQLSIFDFAPKKETVLTSKAYPLEFSFSALEVYKTCPLQYKYQYVLKIPTIPTAAESFGVSVHQTLQRFSKSIKTTKKLTSIPCLKFIDKVLFLLATVPLLILKE
jgi:Superfamily I DNA and RNA helicases